LRAPHPKERQLITERCRATDRAEAAATAHANRWDTDRNDWSIHEDGQEIGRLYEDRTASRPEIAWFWSIIVMGPARQRIKTDGRAPTLEDAKAQFAAAWEAFQRAQKDSDSGKG
jgi:hypothetical protein